MIKPFEYIFFKKMFLIFNIYSLTFKQESNKFLKILNVFTIVRYE